MDNGPVDNAPAPVDNAIIGDSTQRSADLLTTTLFLMLTAYAEYEACVQHAMILLEDRLRHRYNTLNDVKKHVYQSLQSRPAFPWPDAPSQCLTVVKKSIALDIASRFYNSRNCSFSLRRPPVAKGRGRAVHYNLSGSRAINSAITQPPVSKSFST
jgi:hypothetical protein